jgi:hypothetical protein
MHSNLYSNMYLKYKNKYSNKHPNKYKPKLIRRVIPLDANLSSILGKRNYNNTFGQDTYEDNRYGQHIDLKYFVNRIGHAVEQKK